jgi:hypothetical protein
MAKLTVNQLESISVRKLSPVHGWDHAVWNGSNIRIEWTPCTLGGAQPWFNCPHCGRRAVFLYAVVRGVVACRRCLRLAYRCQRETAEDRAFRRVEKIRRKLGWPPGIANGHGWKPGGMHWRTFQRLSLEHDRCAIVCNGFLLEWWKRYQAMRAGGCV